MKSRQTEMLGEVHKIDEGAELEIEISAEKISSTIDGKDLSHSLVRTIVQSESQIKNLLNVLDISGIKAFDQMTDSELYFIRKRERITKPIKLRVSAKDISI